MKEILFPSFPPVLKPKGRNFMPTEDDKMLYDNVDYMSEDELDILCNVVFILPIEFD